MRNFTSIILLAICAAMMLGCAKFLPPKRYTSEGPEKSYYVSACNGLAFLNLTMFKTGFEDCEPVMTDSNYSVKPELINDLLVEKLHFSREWRSLDAAVNEISIAIADQGCGHISYFPGRDKGEAISLDNLIALRVYICSANPDYLTVTKETILKDQNGNWQRPPILEFKYPKQLEEEK